MPEKEYWQIDAVKLARDMLDLTCTAKTADEAHYLCAILNSRTVDDFIRSFSSGGRGFGAPSVVKNLAIPPFDEHTPIHQRLAKLSRQAHDEVRRDRDTAQIEQEINETIEELWNLKP